MDWKCTSTANRNSLSVFLLIFLHTITSRVNWVKKFFLTNCHKKQSQQLYNMHQVWFRIQRKVIHHQLLLNWNSGYNSVLTVSIETAEPSSPRQRLNFIQWNLVECSYQLKIYELLSHYYEIRPYKPGLSLWLHYQLARCNVHWRSFNSRLNFTSNMAENIDRNHCTCGGLVWSERTQITSSVQYKNCSNTWTWWHYQPEWRPQSQSSICW